MTKGHIGSCLQTRKIILKGCIYHLVQVRNTDANRANPKWVPIVNEFP